MKIPAAWNATGAPFPRDKRIHDLFEEQVVRTPGAVAAVVESDSLSYEDLNRRAETLARILAAKGAGGKCLVPLCLERSLEMVIGILGVLKAGGAYVPLEPDLPEDRLAYLLGDLGAPVLLTQRRWAGRLARLVGERTEVIAIDWDWASKEREFRAIPEAKPPGGETSPTDPAYVIYTSGTTGRPKGVVVEHRALCNRITWMQDAYQLQPADRVLQKTPYSFDVSGWEFFWPLIVGARLVFARPGGHKDPHYLREIMQGSAISVLHFVPSMLQAFLLVEAGASLPSLKKVFCSGEALPVTLKDLFFERYPTVELHNLYGPTEAAIDVTAFRCRPEDRLVPIGKPIANTQIYIVDEELKALPAGETGELCIGGECLARGYLHQPELTAEKFVPNPNQPGARMYRTGDLARWLPDGNIEYLGRADSQIKIRGNRVELGEIETVILEQEGVSACAVVATGGELDQVKLAAYIAPDPRQAKGVSCQLRLASQGRLAGTALHALANGLEVAHLNPSETEFLYREIFVNHAYLRHGIRLEAGDCVLDVGANIGLFSLSLFLNHERLRIHAFEPIPEIHRVLALNAELFGGGWTAHHCGLSDAPGAADFTYYPHLTMVSGAEANQAEEMAAVRSVLLREQSAALKDAAPGEIEGLIRNRLDSRTVRCELRTVSDIIREQHLDTVHLLKIDVEKLEERVLAGIQAGDWDKIQQLVIEVHAASGRLERITALLAEKGYTVATDQDDLLGGTPIYQIYARQARRTADPGPASVPKLGWSGPAAWVRRLREALAAKLPDYMIPAAIVPLESLPLTSNGKLDRKALAQRELAPPRRKKRALPRSEIEARLASIWEELLGMVDIGPEEGFFELGGNSLLAVRAADRISKEFGCQYPVVSLLQHARIREIGAYLESHLGANQGAEAEKAVPAASAQPLSPSDTIAAIEAVLNRHPAIRQSVVVNRDGGQGGESLVAFAIPNEDYFRERIAAKNSQERLEQWVSVWEKNYQPIREAEASSPERVNSIGYVRSDSGEAIPEEELRDSIALVVRQVMAHQPKCILEIGCGTGMLLFQFAGLVERYLATDLSQNALEHIAVSLKDNPHASRVSCFHCDASNLSAVPVEAADLVVINSVAQYFPGIDYLSALLDQLARRLPRQARIFIGDVRDLRLLRLFHIWTLQRQCAPGTSKRRFRQLLADRIKLEKELVIHPAYFRNLPATIPRIQQVLIEPKPGKFQNEFVRFRFDVWLCLDAAQPEGVVPVVRPWPPGETTLEDWARTSSLTAGEAVYLADMPNRRLWPERAVLAWLESPGEDAPFSEILEARKHQPGQGLDPAECLAWAEAAGFQATLHAEHEQEDGRFELYLRPAGQPGGELPAHLQNRFSHARKLSNLPSLMLDWEEHVPALKAALRRELPGVALPAKFLAAHEFPLLANGAIDRDELAGRKSKTAVSAPARPAPLALPEYYSQSLAIIGISCAFPGAAQAAQFWNNLCQGVESGRFYSADELRALGVPEERIKNPRFIPLRLALEGQALFDADFFNIPPRQAGNMDPQARLLLVHSWQAMEDAGYAAGTIPDTAVFMSAANNYYPHALGLQEAELQGADGHEAGLFGQPGMIPAWISYYLGLNGPSQFVQSLCCSSMTGLHLACRSLLASEASYALVGAASLFSPHKIGYLYEPGLTLSPDGHCRPFDAAPSGMVEGEGVCVVLLKRAADAVRDRDHIYALLRGVGVSNDGAEKAGFNVPSLKGQVAAIRKVLRETGVAADSIRYVEAHGNGTPLGDAIEVAALSEAYACEQGQQPRCGLGSAKPNIGNVDTVGGLAGCVKIAFSLGARAFPPVANFHRPNPAIPFAGAPFYVVERKETWPEGGNPVRIAQHIYSVGGMNAHAIYEDYRPPASLEVDAPIGPALVPLSARSEERLRESARRLLAFLKARPATTPEADARYLVNLAYTLQVGRQAMAHRVVLVVGDCGDLIQKLDRFAGGASQGEGIIQGETARARDLLQLLGDEREQRAFARQRIAEKQWERLAHLWVRGAAVEWRALYGERLPFRVSLPAYPFAQTEHGLAKSGAPQCTEESASRASEQRPAPGIAGGSARERAVALLRNILGDILKVAAKDLDADRPFREAGLDSVELIRFANRLNQEQGLNLTPPELFEHSTIHQLAQYVATVYPAIFEVAPMSSEPIAPRESAPAGRQDSPALLAERREPIAIIGLSGRFPQAANLEEFWANLATGRDCVSEIPPERWPATGSTDPDFAKIKWGGVLEGIDEFDPLFFNLSPREAAMMDPQNRLQMMHVWLAMENAGYAASRLSGTRTALYIATAETGYSRLTTIEEDRAENGFLGIHAFSGPNRMSYFLNVNGPSEPINTGCSSSLVAVHKAVMALQNGECDLAFAGGVNTVPIPDYHLSYRKAGMICDSGRCRAFSTQADGFVWGEGVGVLLLKRLREAEADGDPIHAVILGSAQNHGGRANSFTAPNPAAQAQVITAALRQAGVDPRTVGFIETHGTGTKLGDPVEIAGLKKAFHSLTAEAAPGGGPTCGLGSVKSNIGHLELASGIAGLLKVVLQLKHKTLAPNLHCPELNPLLQLEGSPFYVVRETVPWPVLRDGQGRDIPRRAGVSSFGVGGVNAHVVVEEYVPPSAAESSAEGDLAPFLVVLSAKRDEALRAAVAGLRQYFEQHRGLGRADLRRIAYTLQVGRDALAERLGLLVNSVAELEAALREFQENGRLAPAALHGQARPGEPLKGRSVAALVEAKDYRALLAFWVNGGEVDWNLLYGGARPARVALPGYPFARERYWATPMENPAPKKADLKIPPAPEKSPVPLETCLLEKIWREHAANAPGGNGHAGSTLVLVNEDSIQLVPHLGGHGYLIVGNHRVPAERADYIADFRDAALGGRLGETLVAACADVSRIVDLSDLYREARAADEPKLGKLALYQALAGTFTPRRILYFTQGLQNFGGILLSLAGAKFIGLIKMLGAEYSHIIAKAIDIDHHGFESPGWLGEVVAREFHAAAGDVEIGYRHQKRYVPQLVLANAPVGEPPLKLSANAVYVITGGTRGIGLEIARHLVSQGARKLALLGLQPLPPKNDWVRTVRENGLSEPEREKLQALIALEQNLEDLRVYSGSLIDREALRGFFEQVRTQCGPIQGLVHSAGAYPELNSRAFVSREIEKMERVLEPKMNGLETLHEIFAEERLDFFVTFSSLSGLVPRLARGLGDYAMANAFADHFAAFQFHARQRPHYRTISWVDWNDTGYAVRMTPPDKARLEDSLNEIGLAAFSAREGCQLFDLAMRAPQRSWVLPCHVNRAVFQKVQAELLHSPAPDAPPAQAAPGLQPEFLERVDRQLARWQAEPNSPLTPEVLAAFAPFEEIQKLDPARIGRIHDLMFPQQGRTQPLPGNGNGKEPVAKVIRRHLFNVLKIQELDDSAPFQDYGLTSISGMVLFNRLGKELKRDLDPGWLVDYPTVQALAAHLEAASDLNRQ